MKKNKLQIDRPKLTEKEIEGFKDFGSMMRKYKTSNRGLKKLNIRSVIITSFAGIAAIIVILVLFYLQPSQINIPTQTQVQKPSPSFVNPPVKQWDVPFKKVFISNIRDTLVKLSSGSAIKFPEKCLEDTEGNTISSNIEVRYREFPTPAELFLSGIPMVYDSAGIRSTFESAGMIEVYAFNENKPLRIKKDHNVEISLVSGSSENNYNLYYLDTISKNWIYKGKETLLLPEYKSSIRNRNNSVNRIEKDTVMPLKPIEPVLTNKNRWHLTLDLVPGEFPELDLFNSTVFEIDETFRPLNKEHSKIVWENILLKQGPRPMTYFITFKSLKDSSTYLVTPVLSKSQYTKAKEQYDSLYTLYKQALENRQKNEIRQSNKFQFDSTLIRRAVNESLISENTIIRSFTIQNFGIWNCDRIRNVPNPMEIKPVFMIDNVQFIEKSYLADCTSNSLITYYPHEEIKLNKKAKNLLWLVTYKNEIAVFTNDDFKKLSGNKKQKLNMRIVKTPVNSAEDFIKLYKKDFQE